jgi:hydroxymethylglutaryl-CoA lyase
MNWPRVIYTEEVVREGFGIERADIDLQTRLDFIHALSQTGLQRITLGAFVSPKFVPQMACFEELLRHLQPKAGVSYLTFVHNPKARQMARQFSPPLTIEDEICSFAVDLCDVHQRRNVNRSIQQMLDSLPKQAADASARHINQGRVAVYSAWGSNFLGKFSQAERLDLLSRQIEVMNANAIEVIEIGLHDSQSWCLPHEMQADLIEIKRRWPAVKQFHLHMHNARGMAMACLYVALQTLDASDTVYVDGSLGGIAGGQYCGNGVASAMVPTEDFLHMLSGMGIHTGVDISRLIDCVWMLENIFGHAAFGHVSKAGPRPEKSTELYSPNLPAIESLQAARHFKLGPQAYQGQAYSPWSKPIPEGLGHFHSTN